ncbi:hypothetical protein YQE_12020, partial [Dendroctonus ponderosae]
MENPCKPPIEEKLYSCPRLSDASGKIDSAHAEVRQVECGKGFGLFGGKKSAEATPPPLIPEEMAPPPYSDLGKKAQDVFNKGYHFGLVKLDIKTKSASGVEFATGGSSNQESGKVAGSLETKYKVKDYGLTFTEKWTTDNTLSTEMAVQDQLVPGLKLSSALNFAPQTGGQYHIQDSNVNVEFNTEQDWGKLKTNALWRPLQKTGNVKAAYVNKQVAINADSDFRADGPIVSASAVVGYQGWLAGYLAGYDVNNKKLTKSNFALGFTSGDFTLHSNVDWIGNDADDQSGEAHYGGSIYQAVNAKLEYGIMVDWFNGGGESDDKENSGDGDNGGSKTLFGVGAQYQLDPDASLRFKVNSNRQIGLGYQQRLREELYLKESLFAISRNDGQDFGGSIYQKLNPQLETGISLNWSSGSSNTKFGIGAKYDLDQEASLRVKVNNQSQIGLGYQQRLRQGVTLTLSTLIDGKNFNQGGHKIGLALELDA